MKTHLQLALKPFAAACATLALAVIPAKAATMSASSTAPVINDADIANYGDVSNTDKWFYSTASDGGARGQSITNGGAAVRLKSITYQVSEGNGAAPTKTYALRVGKLAGNVFTQVHSETATQNFAWTSGQYMTWTFSTPVLLEPYTTYGIDVGMTGSTSNWQSGIPYINVTGDDYAGGTSYASGTGGIGTSSISAAIASDRTFHLDIERPLDPVFSLVAPSPADNATDVFASREIVMTFSQNVTPGAGNLIVRDITDPLNPIETQVPYNDSRLTYDQNVVRLNPAGLIDWNKNYAIRLDGGLFLGNDDAPIAAITDDTTWNFTTIAADPLLAAIAALKAHILNTTPLTGPEISAHKTTIDNQRQRFAESTTTINAVFNLISTYDTSKGPLFVSGFANNATSFDRNNITPTSKNSVHPENYHWVVYTVMQHAMDLIYTAENLAEYEATLTNYKFGSHTSFPGPCPAPADLPVSHTVQINGSFPATFGRNTQMWTSPARKPTGTYLAPGTVATVTVPPELVNAGYKVRVGAHSWDLSARRPVNRLERATRLFALDATSIKVASPYGGGIYIEVPFGADLAVDVVPITVTGAVRAPYFSAKSFHQTTPAQWDNERTNPAPWADFQSDKFMIQVPRKWIYNMTGAQAVQLMVDWDKAMDAINDLMGFDRNRGKETMYCQTDVILRSSVHAPGYPAVNVTSNVNSEVSPLGYAGNYLVRGPATTLTAANIEFHEQGHAYGFPKFGGESESNVNLLQPAMLSRAFGKTFDEAQNGSFGGGNSFITVDTTAIAWMTVFNFSPREVPMAQGEKAYQHKGHGKFMDVARLFGWDKLDAYWRSFMLDDASNTAYGAGTDDLLLRLSRHVGKDIRPLFHFWGIHPQNPTTLAAAIAAENIPASIEIRNQLLHYKTLVPADNAAFRTFASAWRGKQPSINGAWEEREHARQWDTTALYGVGDQQRSEATNPGEIYNENSANDIRNRVQELVDLYFPSAITPNPMTFAIEPTPVNATTVGMVATTASAAIGPIKYFFDETSGNPGGTDSGWQTDPSYQDTGLTPGLTYSYTVTASDNVVPANLTDPSAVVSVPLTVNGDVTKPAPDAMTFATPPYAVDENTITMTATSATDINSVEYEFENTSGGGSSSDGWQASPTFIDAELSPSTEYGYRVRARDSAGNTTSWSGVALANTADIPDVTSPQIISLSPANGTDVTDLASNLVVTFDEPVARGNGSITLKNLTDSTEIQFSVGNPAVSVAGSVMTINPGADLLFGKTYAVQMDANAVADASNNPSVAIENDTTWRFDAILADPIADPGGPYRVPLGGSLALVGSASQPSDGENIADPSGYEWDLNNDGTFGDVTGATPTAINDADLLATWGMVLGTNAVGLKVTDSAGKTATATAVVNLGINLAWDSNAATANQTDGGGAWLDANQWRDDGVNAGWTSGATATFGNGGAGGAVTLAGPTTVASITFNSFTGTYTLGTAATVGTTTTVDTAITLNTGITKNVGGTAATIISPITLGGAQTWTNNSAGTLTSSGGLANGGFLLTIGGSGNTTFAGTSNVITGNGGLTKNGSGTLFLGAGGTSPVHNYTGPTTVTGGVVMVNNNKTAGNMTLNNAMLTDYYRVTTAFTKGLGTGDNQIQVYGDSGFGGGNGNSTWRIGTAGSVLTWGSTYFNPTSLKFLTSADNMGPTNYGQASLDNGLNLNGAARTVSVLAATGTNAITSSWGRINGIISGIGGSLIKTGGGNLILPSANTYDGGTTVQAGMLQLGSATALGATSGPLTVNGGLLNLNNQTVSIGNLGGTGGTIANNGANARTLTIGTGDGTGGIYQGVIANNTNAGTGTVALTKTGNGTITLANSNTYTGATIINGGGTLVLTGATQATTAITFAGDSSLGLAIGSPVTAASAAVNFSNGKVSVTGTPSASSHVLLTASSFSATPVLASEIPGYKLEVVGNQLQLNQIVTDPYATWSGGAAFDADTNNDGVHNGLAFLLGAANVNVSALNLLPTVTQNGGNLILNFNCLPTAARGDATLRVEHSSDLGVLDLWTATTAVVPDVTNSVPDNNVTFVVGAGPVGPPALNSVTAIIDSAAAGTGKLFGRLKATE